MLYGPLVNDIGFAAKSAIIFPDLQEKQKGFNKPAPVSFACKVFTARWTKMDMI
ncbi:hypothetical protein MuYL_0244 [Mucilaginibacter xinganensis]|uniref:Uncharacterized protein n=1 Tax=Mucilaginibacter xinganensis TaxID=1234841 RepID=A0A223NQN6_9SPHI|nr:hypothetical protein MuYL_0244 [Mucilaginibacter xinganensis]